MVFGYLTLRVTGKRFESREREQCKVQRRMEAEKGYSRDLVIVAGSDAQSLGMLKDALLSQIRLYEAVGIYFFGPITTHGQPEISAPYLTF